MNDDSISREALRRRMYHEAFETYNGMQRWDSGLWIRYKIFENAIEEAPAVEPERKKGKWLDDKGLYMCSCCKHLWSELWWTAYCPMDRMYKTMPFCQNCGAEMEANDAEIH